MNKDGLFYRIASRLYKILICILAPICFLRSLLNCYGGISNVSNVLTYVRDDYLTVEDLISADTIGWFVLCLVVLTCAFVSHQFLRIWWPKLFSKKIFILFCFYYLFSILCLICRDIKIRL